MDSYLAKKNILLGITGSVAAYKGVELARLLVKSGCDVKIVMTSDAEQFIHPNSFLAITGNHVYTEHSEYNDESCMSHISLAKWADMFLICPATASTIGKIASGICDNLLTTICTSITTKIFLAPAMNRYMWENNIVQENITKLERSGYVIIHPANGQQACGDVGCGRMQEPDKIIEFISHAPLKKCKVLITAGPTIEPIDPIRCITNHSSGKMGYMMASVLHDLGAEVSLITGPTHIAKPKVNRVINVTTAGEMLDTVLKEINEHNIFISVAAVADYRLSDPSVSKIKKSNSTINLKLEITEDILATVAKQRKENLQCIIGFAAETDNIIENAQKKLSEKKLDFIVVNKVEQDGYPFSSDTNKAIILDRLGNIFELPQLGKRELAYQLSKMIRKYIDVG